MKATERLNRAVAVAQHHDAITGTEKQVSKFFAFFVTDVTPIGLHKPLEGVTNPKHKL
jgi:hypothetical protein